MSVSKLERTARETVTAVHKAITPTTVYGTAIIRQQALEQFTKELDAKLLNLQEGETLRITFRVDIAGKDGNIRSGRGSQRKMPDYTKWRTAVFERDHYRCQDCGAFDVQLNAHHIKSWARHPSLRFDVSNGVTLCEDCHKERHPDVKVLVGSRNGETENDG